MPATQQVARRLCLSTVTGSDRRHGLRKPPSDRCGKPLTGSSAPVGRSRMTKTKSVSELRVQVFADGADKASMLELYRQPYIQGFTTNPTLMRKAGVIDYERFAREILQQIPDRPISFEVFADDETEMERQARKIGRWAGNVYVKIPVTNTRREPMYDLIRRLSV